MASSEMEIDSVLHALGPMGVFAVVQCSLFYLGYLTNAHHLFSFVFTGQFRYDLRYDLRHGHRSRTNYMDLTFIQGHTYYSILNLKKLKGFLQIKTKRLQLDRMPATSGVVSYR